MQILREGVAVERFFERLGESSRGLLLLDYDGTLAPFREDRDEAVPYPGVRERLATLGRADPAGVALVSGRPAREVASLLGAALPLEIWGCHGWEHLDAEGALDRLDPGEDASRGLERALAEALEVVSRDRVEHKGGAVAVHFRGLHPGTVDELSGRVAQAWEALVEERPSLDLRVFDGGLEIRAGDRDKGTVVGEVLDRVPEWTPAAYLGDDRTDEDAFRALRARGGLSVLVRPEIRSTEADLWLRPPRELLAFLDRWARARAAA